MSPEAHLALRCIIEALADAAFAVDGNFRLLCANAAARELFVGIRDGVPVSRAVRAPEILDTIHIAQRTGPQAVMWLSRVPIERQFDVRAAPLDPELADVVLVSLRDTTEVRRVERMRADFVANASHELRTPLASLIGFVETLQGPARDDAAARARFLAIMGEQARRMSRLIDDLLSLSRIEQSLHLPPVAEVDLGAIAMQMCDALAPLAADRNMSVRCDAPHPTYVRGDRDELLRVTENLLENAIKYAGRGTVTVRVADDGYSGSLTVEDEGPGIAPEHLPRLTERFYRIDDEASRAKGGTGLGLAIVKHILARHRGNLRIASKLGEGASFTAIFPLAST